MSEPVNKCNVLDTAEADPLPPILMLKVDHFEEIFDLLDLKDLSAINKTCKRLRAVAGYYFRETYSLRELVLFNQSFKLNNTNVDDFSRFIQNLTLNKDTTSKDFELIGSTKFNSLKCIHLSHMNGISLRAIEAISEHLRKIQELILDYFIIDGDLYETILRACPNLKYLKISSQNAWSLVGEGKNWLRQKYLKLEHLELDFSMTESILNELQIFLKQNKQLKALSINYYLIDLPQQLFIESDAKLEMLHICVDGDSIDLDELCTQLDELNRHGFYQRLELQISHTEHTQELPAFGSFPWLEKLIIESLAEFDCNELHSSTKLKKLTLIQDPYSVDGFLNMETLPEKLLSLEEVKFAVASFDFSIWLSHAVKLKKIFVNMFENEDGMAITVLADLVKWNEKRKKLTNASKTTIYVDDEVYQATKWAVKDIDLSHITVRRKIK